MFNTVDQAGFFCQKLKKKYVRLAFFSYLQEIYLQELIFYKQEYRRLEWQVAIVGMGQQDIHYLDGAKWSRKLTDKSSIQIMNVLLTPSNDSKNLYIGKIK